MNVLGILSTLWKQRPVDSLALIAVAVIGIASMSWGAWGTYSTLYRHPQAQYLPLDDQWVDELQAHLSKQPKQPNETASQSSQMYVDISGAVKKPGVYALSEGSRYQDIVLMAGGFLDSADKNFIHQQINLAQSLQDQEKVFIPFAHQAGRISPPQVEVERKESVGEAWWQYLNTANKEEIDALPDIGSTRLQKILETRPYDSEAEATEIIGLPLSVIQKIREKIEK